MKAYLEIKFDILKSRYNSVILPDTSTFVVLDMIHPMMETELRNRTKILFQIHADVTSKHPNTPAFSLTLVFIEKL